MDLVKELGALALAGRLRRLSDRLRSEASCLYHSCGIDFEGDWFLVAYALSRTGAMTISEIARRTGLSRPAISAILEGMAEHGLVNVRTDPRDLRCRRLSLTAEGEETVVALEPVWRALDRCTRELIEGTGADCLGAIERIEDSLESRSLFSRVSERILEDADRGLPPGGPRPMTRAE